MHNKLIIAKSGIPATLDPAFAQSCNEHTIVRLAYETLVTTRFDENACEVRSKIGSGLASHWFSEQDGLTWVFVLEKQRYFSDNSLVDAVSVRDTFYRLKRVEGFSFMRFSY